MHLLCSHGELPPEPVAACARDSGSGRGALELRDLLPEVHTLAVDLWAVPLVAQEADGTQLVRAPDVLLARACAHACARACARAWESCSLLCVALRGTAWNCPRVEHPCRAPVPEHTFAMSAGALPLPKHGVSLGYAML
jgi:hypothetical protein